MKPDSPDPEQGDEAGISVTLRLKSVALGAKASDSNLLFFGKNNRVRVNGFVKTIGAGPLLSSDDPGVS